MASITKRGISYRITVSLGRDINNKQNRKYMEWTPEEGMTERQIEKEVLRQAVLFEESCKKGLCLDGSMKWAEFSERYISDYARPNLKKSTVAGYEDKILIINQAFGNIRVKDLRPHHFVSFYKNLGEEGIRRDTKYTLTTDFSKWIKKCGKSKIQISRDTGICTSVIRTIETGGSFNKATADKLLTLFNGKSFTAMFKPVKDDRKLSAKTIRNYHALLSSMMTTAVIWQMIEVSPLSRIKAPKVIKKEARYLDDEGSILLLEKLEEAPIKYKAAVYLCLYGGYRRGELCGLEWSDIDLDSAMIDINKNSLYLSGVGIYTDTPKSEKSNREFKLPRVAIDVLRQYRVWQLEERLKLGDKWIDTGRIFTAWNGNPIHPDTITNWFGEFIKKNNLPPACLHSLRHTNATLLIAEGVDIRTVAERLGHAQPSTTTNIYAHAIKVADEKAAQVLDNLRLNRNAK